MSAAVECCNCGAPLDPSSPAAHWTHEPGCGRDCRCDLYVCASCCTEPCCRPAVIPGQTSLLDAS